MGKAQRRRAATTLARALASLIPKLIVRVRFSSPAPQKPEVSGHARHFNLGVYLPWIIGQAKDQFKRNS